MPVEIYIDFDENDSPVISVRGAKGKSCRDLTKGIEQALGQVVTSTTTPEYDQREEAHANSRTPNQRRR